MDRDPSQIEKCWPRLKAFQLAGDRLATKQRDQIERLTSAVREAIQTHETQRLKTANAALDDATQELAALIVERAITNKS